MNFVKRLFSYQMIIYLFSLALSIFWIILLVFLLLNYPCTPEVNSTRSWWIFNCPQNLFANIWFTSLALISYSFLFASIFLLVRMRVMTFKLHTYSTKNWKSLQAYFGLLQYSDNYFRVRVALWSIGYIFCLVIWGCFVRCCEWYIVETLDSVMFLWRWFSFSLNFSELTSYFDSIETSHLFFLQLTTDGILIVLPYLP